jgi:single-stranded DNA-binding protein
VFNTVTLVGILMDDPKTGKSPRKGTPWTSMRVQSENNYNRPAQKRRFAKQYFTVFAYGATAVQVAEVARKGYLVIAHGRLEQKGVTGSDGMVRWEVVVVASQVAILPQEVK